MIPAERNPRTDRAEFELRATGVKPEAANPLRSGIHTRGYLPHVKREGASYFVTFRLIDSLPTEFLLKAESEKAERLHRLHAQQEAAKKLLDRTGQAFWQPEGFDHWIRNDEEHARCCGYVRMNPVKAGLCRTPEDWRWSSSWRGEGPNT